VTVEKIQVYVVDAIITLGAGGGFLVQMFFREKPDIEVMGFCLLILTGRTAVAIGSLLGARTTNESSPSPDPPQSPRES
jgi:hypothetical protein